QYLIGNPDNGYHGAHARYRPQDWTFTACRQKLRLAREKALTYDEICDHFKPVLHHFFLEHFPSADVWYEKRQRYRRTLAVSSMVSYIIGLGDRHTNNILLDVASGDLIHIDFGVVFEQGKLLAIPELVPFRLTRDLVDGLGCLGVAGCFKRDCETTMEVLRRVSPLVVSIVEVLLFDPLYRWCLDPRRILQDSDKSLALSPSSRPGNGPKKGEQKRGRDGGGRGRGKRTSVSTLLFAEQKGRKRGRHEAIPEAIPSSSAHHENGAAGAAEETRDHENSVDDVKRKLVDSEMPIVEDILTKAEGNMNAKLAVLTVRRKLEGYEEGEIAQLSVNAHVARLVNAAQDRTALAQMFVGWAPWV
ncbi:FATC domain-containing protein, partial [Toxoplasma gondii GAB2-2007-GAL-DOM2]